MSENKYKLLNDFASIVFVGYPLSIPKFRELLNSSEIIKKLHFQEKTPDIKQEINIPQEQIKQLISNIPLSIYTSERNNFEIIYLSHEKKLSFSIKENFDKSNKDDIKAIIDTLLGCNLSSFTQIGFNFISRYEFNNNEKLKLLNEDIEKIKIGDKNIWEKNRTFILTVPFQFEDHISTYKIQKMIPVNPPKDNRRIYQIDVNQNFNLGNVDNLTKNNEIVKIISQLESLYLEEYKTMCNNFLKMYYE